VVQVTWIPVDHHAAKIEDCDPILCHRGYILARWCFCLYHTQAGNRKCSYYNPAGDWEHKLGNVHNNKSDVVSLPDGRGPPGANFAQ
jgi:hypothetical protein